MGCLKWSNTKALLLPPPPPPFPLLDKNWLDFLHIPGFLQREMAGATKRSQALSSLQHNRSKYAVTAPRHEAHVSATSLLGAAKAGRRQLPCRRAYLPLGPTPPAWARGASHGTMLRAMPTASSAGPALPAAHGNPLALSRQVLLESWRNPAL